MDSVKTAVANVADLLDRQLAQCDYKFNNGLPYNLTGGRMTSLPSVMVLKRYKLAHLLGPLKL
nr:hypothetical protein [Vibrio taketomensis]